MKKELQDRVEEAINMSKVMVVKDAEFCVEVAKKFLGDAATGIGWDIFQLLFILYRYGEIVGKRAERSKKRRAQHEL